jgi:hypothetical protein
VAAVLHLTKLAVGVTDLTHLAALQAARRASSGGILRHLTRSFPRRSAEVTDGGSMYWVVAGMLCVRQPILDIVEAAYDDGSRCAAIMLDQALVPVRGRRTKPFQGWRYLAAGDAPPDLTIGGTADGIDELPPALLQELRSLGLL